MPSTRTPDTKMPTEVVQHCQKCASRRLAHASCRCDDKFCIVMTNAQHQFFEGPIPTDLGLDMQTSLKGDYLEIQYCMSCGHLQGQWPLPETGVEKGWGDGTPEGA